MRYYLVAYQSCVRCACSVTRRNDMILTESADSVCDAVTGIRVMFVFITVIHQAVTSSWATCMMLKRLVISTTRSKRTHSV
jgi:hypothetical protein